MMAAHGSVGQKIPLEEQGGLSPEKLVEKYKSALGIAQKAKNARDEAIKKNTVLQSENEHLKEKVVTLEKQYKTVEEMLAALTDQKLKLAMEIDDLKKEKRIYFEELKVKEKLENEAESYKSQYKKVLKNNEELISSTESTISKMRKEHEDLKRHNETLKQLCNNIQMEKSELEKTLNINLKNLSQYEENQNALNSVLSKKYKIVVDEFRMWSQIIDSKEDSYAELQLLQMENEALKSEKDKFNSSMKSLTKDKENMEQEILELNERIKKICLELDSANADRDKMLNNLEEVSLETKRLIENSESLTTELGKFKEERTSMEHATLINNEKLSFYKIIEEKETIVEQLTAELRRYQQLEEEHCIQNFTKHVSLGDGDTSVINEIKSETNDFVKEESLEKERSVNIELHCLHEDLQAISAEIERYKIIVKESETKLQEALEALSEKEVILKNQNCVITELKSKLSHMESLQVTVADSLIDTRRQLLVALEELEVIERLKDNLEHECELKDEEFLVACHKQQYSERLIKDIVDGMEGLRAELNSIHKIDSIDEEFDTNTSNSEQYILGLKKCLEAIISKMYQNYKEEIENLKDIINEYQENNEALANDNNKLSKQAKDLLNEQANYDNSLVQKLKTFKENLLHQLKEKQSMITKLENEGALLKEEINDKVNINKGIEIEKYQLKCEYDKLISESSAEIKKLSEKLSELENKYGESLSSDIAKNEIISNLEDKIKSLNINLTKLESSKSDFEKRNSGLNDAIIALNSEFEKENKELKNLILSANFELVGNVKESTNDSLIDNSDIHKCFSQLKLHQSFVICLSKGLERLKTNGDIEKEEITCKLNKFNEENTRLNMETKVLTEEINHLKISLSNLKKAITTLIELCHKEEVSFVSTEVKAITQFLPDDLLEKFANIKILEIESKGSHNKKYLLNKISGLELSKEELQNKILGLESNTEELQNKISGFESDKEKLKNKILGLESNKEELLKKITNLESKIDDLQNKISGLELNKEELQNKILSLESNKEELHKKIIDFELKRDDLQNKISSSESNKDDLQNKISGLELNKEELQNKILSLESNQEELHKKIIDLKLKRDDLQNKISGSELNKDELQNKISGLELNKEELQKKLFSLESLIKDKEAFIKGEIEEKDSIISSLKSDICSFKENGTENAKKDSIINSLKADISSLREKHEHISSLNDSLNFDLSNFKENLERLRSEFSYEKDLLLDNNHKLQNELKDCKELLDFKSLELRENNRIWAGRFSSLKVALIGLNKTRKEIKNHFEFVECSFNSFIDQIREPLQEKVDLVVQDAVAASKAELIREMHQMNQALKERGESISKLEFTVTDCHNKIKQQVVVSEKLQSELIQAKAELLKESDVIKEKDQLIKQLEVEIDQLREAGAADNSDVLSTSTISKTEEHSRLKDVEDSFEDRYMKLKLIAVKLKKRAADVSQTLETERLKAASERAELQEKISSMSMAVKNAQKIQELFDESLDERDRLKKDNVHLKNTVEELKNNENSFNNRIISLENSNQNIPIMKKHIDSLNSTIKESKSEMQRLQMEIKAEAIKYDEVKKNAIKLEGTVQELTRQLEQAKQQGKNNSVLELEMKNYEKIIAEVSSQLNIERASIKSLKSENDALTNVKIGLEEQISILEKQISVEEQRIQDTQNQMAIYYTKLEEKNGQIEALNNNIGEVKKHLSDEKSKNEAITLEMSAVTSDFSKKEMAMLSKISSLQDQIRSLETSLLATKQELDTSKREINHLNEEYESYKLRAQTILSKKKGDLVTHGEKEAKEECDRLKRECAASEERLDACMSEIDTLNTRISSLNLEKARIEKRYEEVRSALQQKQVEQDVLNTELYNLNMAKEIAVEQLKAELTKKKNEYQTELSHHKKIIDDLMLDFKQKEEEAVIKDKTDSSGYIFTNFPENILPSSEREDGEGSESVPSPKTRRPSAVVPLDVLLNSPDESKVSVLQEQVEKLQKDLGSSEVRARHLSSLLSEAEKDSARNLHQNKVLKEEVRRLERALDRQPHVTNTEYLKNVVFKFVTLPNGDERTRLVPVLDTLLKFSPEETHKLSSVAKGDVQAGWGSYLPSWTGL